ncbi:putative GTP cyclohydrolase 1 type 2 NIF3 family [Methanonatronarchaeum thermophilum]|uniref:Putative GTP cyclohydrolase 1 type 2 NIF3 family n=1 Tax=Methanonatronarchaeum thermophilum TaxID=1927129 RepID=A0A1Y3GIF6_9EURY|nr:hypothetical protein [Methanonatronarchaeum thermophilum]OUJ19186.1 putative GTP cyclohydrolase 1 type 2 NIF3 family [Methanonatronarchaeum thermophilum]
MVTLKELHEFAVEEAIKVDPRDKDRIDEILQKRNEKYEDLEGVRKDKYDQNRLKNPYDDSKILHAGNTDVEKIAVGIDIETQDLLLIDRLNEKGIEIDAAIAHHPEGRGLANLHQVMKMQVETLEQTGVSISQAEAIVRGRVDEVRKGVHSGNHPRSVQTATLLDIPYACLHTVADNHVNNYLEKYVEEKNPDRISDLIDILIEIPEYEWALEYDLGPTIFNGKKKNRVGKVAYDMTGGTELSKERLEKMAQSGVNTIIAMHMSKKQIKEAKKQNINVVAAGHISSDSIGLNLLLDKMVDKFNIKVVELSGFKRVTRL